MTGRLEDRLRGVGPVGMIVALVMTVFSGLGWILVPAWARVTGTPWRDLGFSKPRSWAATIALGVVGGVVFKFAMKALIMPLLGAAPVNGPYHYLVGNSAALPWMIVTLVVRAGFGEEAVFRGFLFERLRRLIGPRVWATPAIVVVTSALFALAHYPDQGRDGAVQAMFTGMAFGTTVALTGRLWGVMIAHAAFDLTAVALIYFDVETAVAHLFFA